MKLRVFRVQPQAFDALVESTHAAANRSEQIRRLLKDACHRPPSQYPVRGLKPDLKQFSVFMHDEEVASLASAAESAGVSQSVFVEAVFVEATVASRHAFN